MDQLVHPIDVAKPNMSSNKKPVLLSAFGITFLVIVALVGFLYVALFKPVLQLKKDAAQIQASGSLLSQSAKAQDLPGMQKQLGVIKSQLDTFKSDFSKLAWLSIVPWANKYYSDGNHGITAAYEILAAGDTTINAIAPYADVIGLKGLATTGDGSKTAQDRINFILNTLDKIQPQLTDIGGHLAKAKTEIDQIDPNRYPQTFQGIALRSQMVKGINLLDQASSLVNDAKPLLQSAPYILGLDSARTYLVIFQNDAELRPTGGFMTAYAILNVYKGKISTVLADDIYSLDKKFTKQIPAPAPILNYLPKVPFWYLRDQNLSPDFKVSMDTFYPNYLTTGSPKVDGIIAIDTQVLVDLLKITGPIGVPGFGNFSPAIDSRCNCPQVFYALENYADVEGPVVWDSVSGQIVLKPQNYGARKNFIGPMTYSLLSNVMAQPKSKMADLFNTGINLIDSKHVLFYFNDPKVQSAVESFNLAGRVRDYSGDYLMVVDTNFAGAKTNAWIVYTADQKIDVASDGNVTKTLTLTYKNPQQYFVDSTSNLKLNGVYRDWLRIYVPKGSQLVSASGFETGQATSDDLGKTVFEGFFTLTPLNVKTLTLKYTLPFKAKSPYQFLIQKQGGTKDFSYNVTINGRKQPELILSADKELLLQY